MRQLIHVLGAFAVCGFGNLYGEMPGMLPRVALHRPYLNETDDVLLPTDDKPALIFPVSPTTGLVRLDLIRAARMVRAELAGRLALVVVFVDVKDLDPMTMVNLLYEQRSLCKIGLGFEVELTQVCDDSGLWYEQLGRPALPHAMLVDAKGKILANGLLYGPLEWEAQRIAALLDGRPVPLSPLVIDDTPRPPHPFFVALRDTPRVKGKVDWPHVIERMSRVDRFRANDVLQKFAVNTRERDEARLVAQAALRKFRKEECAWAEQLLDSHESGSVSSSLWRLESTIRADNPSKSDRMSVRVTTTLTSRWDNNVVATFEPSAIVDPGSKVAISHNHFRQKNAGWGDYWAKHVIRVKMSRGEWPDLVEYPEFVRTVEEHVVLAPRGERCIDIEPQERDRTADDFAFWDGYEEIELERMKSENVLSLLSVAGLKNALQAVRQTAQQTLAKLWFPGEQRIDASLSPTLALVGKPFPPIRIDRWVQGKEFLGDGAGTPVDSFGGKVVLLDFMFTGCPPCRFALPTLRRLQEQHRDEGFLVFSLCTSWGAYGLGRLAGNLELTHPVAVLSPGAEESYAIHAYPTYVLIDRAGIVRWVGIGGEPWPSEIEKLLGQNAAP